MRTRQKTDKELLQGLTPKKRATSFVGMRDELLADLLQREPFHFDINSDALYNQLRQSYEKQGQRAAADVYARSAAMTGGYGNSYAHSAAAQAYGSYLDALHEKEMQLYENAYDRYADENDRRLSMLKTVIGLENEQYDRNTDAEKTMYEREQEQMQAQQKSEQDAYERNQDTLNFAYKMAQLGDFSYLKNAGIDVSALEAAANAKKNAPEKISVNIQNNAEETYYYRGYSALIRYLDRQIGYGQLTVKGKKQIVKALTGRTI